MAMKKKKGGDPAQQILKLKNKNHSNIYTSI